MSDAVSALGGDAYTGLVDIKDAGLVGMATVRADFSDRSVKAALGESGLELPSTRNLLTGAESTVLWMSPDEVLVVCAYETAQEVVATWSTALSDQHALVVDVSDARAVLELSGPKAALREVLAKLSPADLAEISLPVGEVRRSRLGQVAAAFWFDAEDRVRVVCFRSVARYVHGLLCQAARPGSDVGYF